MKVAIVLLVAIMAAACSKEPAQADSKAKAPKKPPSTAKQAIDGFTGKTAVKQGKMAQKQLIDISTKKNSELDEVLK